MDKLGQGSGAKEPSATRLEPAPLRLAAFDWTGFVADHFSLSLVGGTFATGIGLVLIDPATWPNWLVFAAPVTTLSLAMAFASLLFVFTRVWKTIREEHETSALWGQLVEEVSPRGTGMENVKDAVFEIPYLFSILVLPFSVVCFQALVACLVLFYACDNYYNLALVRKIGTDDCARLPRWLLRLTTGGHGVRRAAGELLRAVSGGHWTVSAEPAFALLGAAVATACSVVDPAPSSIDRVVLTRFFGRRARLDTLAIWLLLAALLTVSVLASTGSREWALGVGLLAVLALLALESLGRAVSSARCPVPADDERPHRHARRASALDRAVRSEPRRPVACDAHQAPREGLPSRGAPVRGLLHVRAGGARWIPAPGAHRARGRRGSLPSRATSSSRRDQSLEIAFLWYLAIDEERRGRGLGVWMVPLALEVVHDRWPSLRAAFLETGHPPAGETGDDASDEMRRVQFYRRIGFSWVRGLDYQIPAEGDHNRSLRYDPMFVALGGSASDLDDAFVKAAIIEMARDNFVAETSRRGNRQLPDDPRWKRLEASIDGMHRVEPG